jgi:hypothetical protein
MLFLSLCLSLGARAQDTHWSVNIYDFQYDMTVYLALNVDGEAVTDYSNYEVAAFCGDACRGVATVQTAEGKSYCYLRIRSNQASGETITFKVYVKDIDSEGDVEDYSMTFTSQSVQGMPSSPVTLDFSLYTMTFELDENSEAFTASGRAAKVTVKRKVSANNWNTICLPFSMTKEMVETVFGTSVEMAEFTGFETVYDESNPNKPNTITLNFSAYTLDDEHLLTAGKPFLIKTNQEVESFEVEKVQVTHTLTPTEKTDNHGTPGCFVGTFVKTKVPENALFVNGGKLWYSKGASHVKAFRGWFELGAVLGQETNLNARLLISVDGQTTGISNHERTNESEGERIYNLNGQRVGKAARGLYIVRSAEERLQGKNGRKMMGK